MNSGTRMALIGGLVATLCGGGGGALAVMSASQRPLSPTLDEERTPYVASHKWWDQASEDELLDLIDQLNRASDETEKALLVRVILRRASEFTGTPSPPLALILAELRRDFPAVK